VTNIYGEPGTPITAVDGQTSIPADREIISASSDFVAAGVGVGDIVEIKGKACQNEDNGLYIVDDVVNETILRINENWPVGNQDDVEFSVHFLNERYTEFAQSVPFLVKLEPTAQELNKWGLGDKRDAIVVISKEVCEDIGLVPKIGDRFIYPYNSANIHYEMEEMKELDSLGDSGVVVHYIGAARRTRNKLPSGAY
jgi:hypothetical protein